jgi:hypothetical protein
MLLASIIAKALAFADAFLTLFVTATPAAANLGLGGACGNLPVYTTSLTGCGQTIIGALGGLTEASLAMAMNMLGGLMATAA